jgi:Protein of unknown function (DUF3455)
MKNRTRSWQSRASLVGVALAGTGLLANIQQAHAACFPDSFRSCTVNGQPGFTGCIQGHRIPCTPLTRPSGTAPTRPQQPDDTTRSVLTQHNDSMRTGAYLVETQLTPDSVCTAPAPCTPKGPGMALRYTRPVDGNLNAQLLYARRVPTVRGVRSLSDVIFAFTEQNTIYAYDANDERNPGEMTGLIWPPRKLPLDPDPTHITPHDLNLNIPIGIKSTPVIELKQHTLFVVYGISNNIDAEYHLAKLDIRTGNVLRDIRVDGVAGGVVFNPSIQWQRPGLLLAPNPIDRSQRTVYVAFGAAPGEEKVNYHGWVMGYDADTLLPRGVFCSTPDRSEIGEGGGIWQGGAGLAADESGNVYFTTGNGPGSGNDGSLRNHGNSIVKLTPVRNSISGDYDFEVAAFSAAADDRTHITEWERKFMDTDPKDGRPRVYGNDIDLGAGGVTVIPGTSQLVGGGKTGVLYLMDTTTVVRNGQRTMDKLQSLPAFDNIYDPCDPDCRRYGNIGPSFDARRVDSYSIGPHLHGAPTYWLSADRGLVFHWSEKDHLKRFSHDRFSGMLNPSATVGDVPAQGVLPGYLYDPSDPTGDHPWIMPGGLISLSANGTQDGILWITLPWPTPGHHGGRILAYNAVTLEKYWDEIQPDDTFSHNNPPTVADGRVFVGAMANKIDEKIVGKFFVYSLKRGAPFVYEPRGMLPNPLIDLRPRIEELLGRLSPRDAATIAPPQSQILFSLASINGALTYKARPNGYSSSVEWSLVGESGELRDESGVNHLIAYSGLGAVLATADHGLTWTGPDGSQMTWSIEKSVRAPEDGNAPWALFRSVAGGTSNNAVGSAAPDIAPGAPLAPVRTGGVLDAITYVQQIGTKGGAPPMAKAHVGDRVDVPFTATYAFYVAETDDGHK